MSGAPPDEPAEHETSAGETPSAENAQGRVSVGQVSAGQIFEDVACTMCGCVCDDLRVEVNDGAIVRLENACELAKPWFLEANASTRAAAELLGNPAFYETAISSAAALLTAAHAPLVYGLSRSSTPGQRAAVRLADQLRAAVDTTASTCHAPSIMAIQEVGESTCSLGEIKNRADLVVFWGANPVKSHPRHMERYSVDPPGMFVPGGRKDRTVIVIDVEKTETAEQADLFIQVKPGADFEAIWTLRALLAGIEVESDWEMGADQTALADLTQRLANCRCGVFFFGLGLSRTGAAHRNVEALLRLVADLNAHTRFHAKRMRIPGDVTGADSVLCWQTGFPFSVNMNRGYPRYNPGEYSANELLERKEVDACLLVGSEGVSQFSPAAQAYLNRIPTVTLDHADVDPDMEVDVRFTTSKYGIHLPGTVYRMDEVPIPLRPILPATHPSDEQVLNDIGSFISEL